jgi:hypothetical protein
VVLVGRWLQMTAYSRIPDESLLLGNRAVSSTSAHSWQLSEIQAYQSIAVCYSTAGAFYSNVYVVCHQSCRL